MKSVIGLLAAGLCSCAIGEMSFRSGEGWQPFANAKDIEAGSALDFSGMGLVDAPAGKFGWLRAANGHAEFEGRPGVPVRFWGVNICSDANFLEPDEIERLTERLVRLGYNAVRIHHYDDAWWRDDKNRDLFDRLVAACVKKGLYLTTDLLVSRKVKYREIGLD
ncbi:MAG: glycosyl hydrolase family 5, partial [bacterium]|nr:glycosyl hydrolase family 5 [Candidatus Colisoma equi]